MPVTNAAQKPDLFLYRQLPAYFINIHDHHPSPTVSKSDINFSLTHELLENAENELLHTPYAQEKAQNLLTHSDYSLGEISTYLNFSSQSYFISIFKKYTGVTPGQYRKKHRQVSW
ncbi:AraC family transcriptional regulator [uncultured Eubacterium sp.]|uniref:helix-turn-helix domain-containing protein n=1 Tax=uncultured Eubacterium sp. TaxID=165185 RepID=UPI0025F4DC47|nr:helix-turn-helix domain-containing protein [uncultured Eubacterium sp.]